ncbi:MAG: hypothetical protein IIC89_07230 [Chloroflexi bacterium]|nr:hypothetical protein [Chloroflexota bacterium]
MEGPPPQEPRRVPAYVALVRIAAVIGMSATIAFGLFLLIAGVDFFLFALVFFAAAIPFYLLMRFVENLADPAEPDQAAESDQPEP